MKKTGIMNQDISEVIAGLGHNDIIFICGSAFPIPMDGKRIDLALEPGLPAFMDVLRVVLKEMCVEKYIVAAETKEHSPKRFEEICAMFDGVNPMVISQNDLKDLGKHSKAFIRTGECTPYSNVVLVGGVIF